MRQKRAAGGEVNMPVEEAEIHLFTPNIEVKTRATGAVLGLQETRRHFDLRHELHNRPSKRKAKKMKRMREQEAATNPSEASSFKIDVDDDRFSRLFSNPEFAIDPTNPNFKKTAATDELLRVKRMRSSKLQFTRLKQKAVGGQDQQPSGLSFVSTAGPGKTGKSEKQKGKKGFTLFAKNA
uniref:NUC153 domain-containing protein n=4 Tax=Toxoplasma gondii TaxID=5811 RepID=A0A2T6J3K1_TOXGO|nr:NUC153 domain-containing protein [Toxoplasma gondii TgCATBr9]